MSRLSSSAPAVREGRGAEVGDELPLGGVGEDLVDPLGDLVRREVALVGDDALDVLLAAVGGEHPQQALPGGGVEHQPGGDLLVGQVVGLAAGGVRDHGGDPVGVADREPVAAGAAAGPGVDPALAMPRWSSSAAMRSACSSKVVRPASGVPR